MGNGDPSCHESDTFLHLPGGGMEASRSIFNGHARVVLQGGKVAEDLTLTTTTAAAGEEGTALTPATLTVSVKHGVVRGSRGLRVYLSQKEWEEREVVAAGEGVRM